jgi:transcriptional regulator with XRE-family HTH domain
VDTHPLREWRVSKRLTPEQFSALLVVHGAAISAAFITMIERDLRRPSWNVANAIERATEGAVRVATLLDRVIPKRSAAKQSRAA